MSSTGIGSIEHWRVKPDRARQTHAADTWSSTRGGVTLCNREFDSLGASLRRANAIELVECDACRTVLQSRIARKAAEEPWNAYRDDGGPRSCYRVSGSGCVHEPHPGGRCLRAIGLSRCPCVAGPEEEEQA